MCALFKGLCINAMIRSLCWVFSGWKFSVFISVTYTHTRLGEKLIPQQVNQSFNDNLSRAISLQTYSLLYTLTHAYFSKKEQDLEHTVSAEANKGPAHCRRASHSRRQYKHQPGSGVTRVGGQGTEITLWEVRANKQAIKAHCRQLNANYTEDSEHPLNKAQLPFKSFYPSQSIWKCVKCLRSEFLTALRFQH